MPNSRDRVILSCYNLKSFDGAQHSSMSFATSGKHINNAASRHITLRLRSLLRFPAASGRG
ncbi:MAG: hypothetical protein ABTQ34_04665 [Bdellovibrionales bacterium]